MNIFILHESAPLAAAMHCDKHVVKMVLETAQILATVHHIYGNGAAVKYKPTHTKHPCVQWAAESVLNYRWLRTLGLHLAHEYKKRYNKFHACHELFLGELSDVPPALTSARVTSFALAMPDHCKTSDPVESYRNYYRHKRDTTSWMSWEKSNYGMPSWMAKVEEVQ